VQERKTTYGFIDAAMKNRPGHNKRPRAKANFDGSLKPKWLNTHGWHVLPTRCVAWRPACLLHGPGLLVNLHTGGSKTQHAASVAVVHAIERGNELGGVAQWRVARYRFIFRAPCPSWLIHGLGIRRCRATSIATRIAQFTFFLEAGFADFLAFSRWLSKSARMWSAMAE